MKRIIPILVIIASCSKAPVQRPIETVPFQLYLGTYTSVTGDTAIVNKTEDSTIISIYWAANGNRAKITFDSVRILPNYTFTDNETVTYQGLNKAIGSGKFVNNSVDFKFTLLGNGSGDIIFNGIKL